MQYHDGNQLHHRHDHHHHHRHEHHHHLHRHRHPHHRHHQHHHRRYHRHRHGRRHRHHNHHRKRDHVRLSGPSHVSSTTVAVAITMMSISIITTTWMIDRCHRHQHRHGHRHCHVQLHCEPHLHEARQHHVCKYRWSSSSCSSSSRQPSATLRAPCLFAQVVVSMITQLCFLFVHEPSSA